MFRFTSKLESLLQMEDTQTSDRIFSDFTYRRDTSPESDKVQNETQVQNVADLERSMFRMR